MNASLDKMDLSILAQMQRDDTASMGQLAEQLGISKTACWRRVQKLLQQQVIEKRVALVNPEAVNLPLTAFIVIRTNQHNEKWSRQFRQVLHGIPEVLEAYRMSGDVDYLVKAVVSDMKDYDRLYKQLIRADLFDVSSSFVMERIKHTTELPLDHVRL